MMTSNKLNEQRRHAEDDDIFIENNDRDSLSTIMEDIIIANNIAQLTMSMGSRHSHSSVMTDRRLPDSYNERNSLFEFSSAQSIPPYYSVDESTQENYAVEDKHFYGPFKEIRSSLDYNYHGEII